MANKKFYITTSIFYVNSSPHIGSALEMVQADVLARYHRQLNEDVFFLTGTDEHGVKIVRKAEELKKNVKELVDGNAAKFVDLTKVLDLSHNDFIRTTDRERHWPAVFKIWQELNEKGDIYKGEYKGLYCVGCEAYLAPNDLIEGKCPVHKKEPDVLEEENYFFRLSKYAPVIQKIIEKGELAIIPLTRKNEILGLINQGVADISISRPKEKLLWGVPVPNDDSQIVYVWLEALINYISALGYGQNGEKFQRYWPADVHCLGKDILRFHALLWPAVLLSAGLPLPRRIFVHGFLTIEGQKMSKSLGDVVNPFELVKKYGADPVRYFLLREFSSTEDGDFSVKRLEERYNSDLANGLGNLVSRILTLSGKAGISLKDSGKTRERDGLTPKVKAFEEKYHQAFREIKFHEALEAIWQLIGACDEHIEKNKPWGLIENNRDRAKQILSELLVALREVARLLQPFLPVTSEKILDQIKQNKKAEILFPRLP
jgi:methionyl-tRNA synthetase